MTAVPTLRQRFTFRSLTCGQCGQRQRINTRQSTKETLELKTCTINTIDNLRGFAYLRQHGGQEIIALRIALEAATRGDGETLEIEGVLHDAHSGLPGWSKATVRRPDGTATWAEGDFKLARVSVARADIRNALVWSMCHDVVHRAERAMDWSGDYAAYTSRLGDVITSMRTLPGSTTHDDEAERIESLRHDGGAPDDQRGTRHVGAVAPSSEQRKR